MQFTFPKKEMKTSSVAACVGFVNTFCTPISTIFLTKRSYMSSLQPNFYYLHISPDVVLYSFLLHSCWIQSSCLFSKFKVHMVSFSNRFLCDTGAQFTESHLTTLSSRPIFKMTLLDKSLSQCYWLGSE